MSVIIIANGDIFASEADAVVVPVNCLGRPGKGLAKAMAAKWPSWVAPYKEMCARGELHGGDTRVMRGNVLTNEPRFILLAATKEDWRNPSKIEWVQDIAVWIRDWADYTHALNRINKIAIPALGCGEGRLPWDQVRVVLETTLVRRINTHVEIYAPLGA